MPYQPSVLKRILLRLRGLAEGLVSGDRRWGQMRLLFAFLAVVLLMVFTFYAIDLLSSIRLPIPPAPTPGGPPTPVVTPTPGVPQPPPAWMVWLRTWLAAFYERRRYLVAPIAAVVVAFMVGARYVQDIYELKSYRAALRYLVASMFAMAYPWLVISEGKKQLKPGKVNLLDVIGGPGYILIDPGNVVLFERLHGPADVRSAGIHFVSRFEKIKDIVNLEEQIGEFKENEREIKAITKDGIPVTVKNVRFRYRLHPGRRYSGPVGRAWEDPYPFSVKAVLNMAYNRNVRADGLATWEEAIKFALDTAISDFIRKNTIDQLVAPGLVGGDPRQTIRKALDSSDIRNRLRNLGAELLFYDIGHFEIPEKGVEEQRLSNWQAKWMGTANLIRSDAEAQRLAYQELGRAEAQAEMLMSIARGLQDAGLEDKGNSKENLQNIILMRTAQILEALTEQNRQPPKDASGSTSPSK